ncbi:unnamed protein product [Coffea canephora]|uniref:Uncharacterized protein n=1 Tax=Coffea canephora TaxID=49390 RepID=A0A068UIJ4_COFCA|nr:unnamed protein product [Coffea canephora]
MVELNGEQDNIHTGRDETCKFDKSKIVAIESNLTVVSTDQDQVAAHLVKHARLSCRGLNSTLMHTYLFGGPAGISSSKTSLIGQSRTPKVTVGIEASSGCVGVAQIAGLITWSHLRLCQFFNTSAQ